ncbi:hypothetical protein FH972_024384 [Carpinus fangiana]|uniref:Phospholipid scramblase n=1 Tax=Carpinus fangiana TaxID=176857 RepID=A0A5N6KYB0_9ROSI|nr:hypothetical protein FH972_024384 [Carpinus fangiana]
MLQPCAREHAERDSQVAKPKASLVPKRRRKARLNAMRVRIFKCLPPRRPPLPRRHSLLHPILNHESTHLGAMNQPRTLLRLLPRRGFASVAARRSPRQFDSTGRGDGFARRIPKQQASGQPPPAAETTGASATPNDSVANALRQASQSDANNLLAPVHVPEDKYGILRSDHPSTSILANSTIVVHRQLEMMNVMLGFEQANKYVIMDGQGNHIGYLAEQDHGLGSAMARQFARLHRSFTTHVFDRHEKEVLRFYRPFSWISSRIRVYDAATEDYTSSDALSGTSAGSITSQTSASISQIPLSEMRIIGEAQQQWAPIRRKYNVFLHRDTPPADESAPQLTSGALPLSNSQELAVVEPGKEAATGSMAQFAYVDEPFLSWDFSLKSADDQLIGSVNRNFSGFGREILTDTGVYVLRMDSAGLGAEPDHLISHTARNAADANAGMTLDQRAVMLATAVSIDFDYFSRRSGQGMMGHVYPGTSGEAAGGAGVPGGVAGGAAGEAGAAGGAVAGESGIAGEAAGAAARGVGGVAASEGAIAGAGTMAGYEAMQGMSGRRGGADDASPTNDAPPPMQTPYDEPLPPQQGSDEDFWGESSPKGQDPSGGQSPDAGEDGGGLNLWDFFDSGP